MAISPFNCLHCGQRPVLGNSRFCSATCKEAFAQDCFPASACSECDAAIDGLEEAAAAGWQDIVLDVEGTSWNYLGTCPDCARELEE